MLRQVTIIASAIILADCILRLVDELATIEAVSRPADTITRICLKTRGACAKDCGLGGPCKLAQGRDGAEGST